MTENKWQKAFLENLSDSDEEIKILVTELVTARTAQH